MRLIHEIIYKMFCAVSAQMVCYYCIIRNM